jgi:hypothetical protein
VRSGPPSRIRHEAERIRDFEPGERVVGPLRASQCRGALGEHANHPVRLASGLRRSYAAGYMAVSLDQPWRRANAVAERTVGGETVLIPIRTSPRERVSVLTLNEVGTFVWARLFGPTIPRAIAQAVTDEFEVGLDEAIDDLSSFLERLRELGLAEET